MKQDVHRSPELAPIPGRVKKRKSRFHVVMALFLSIVAVSIALVVMIIVNLNFKQGGTAEAAESKSAVFGVKSVTVEGETRYSKEAIAGISGIRVGQSIFSVNKRSAAEKVKAAFPYLDTVEISSASFDDIRIKITETEPIGAIYAGGSWIVVGRDGRGLEALPVESERPFRYLYIKGVTPLTAELGKTVLDERSLAIVLELREAFESAGLDGVGVIDLTDKTDIRLDWKNQITIALGNDSNLTYEVRVAVTSLPVVQRRHGATARGELDIRMYADPSVTSPMIIFKSETSSGDDPASDPAV